MNRKNKNGNPKWVISDLAALLGIKTNALVAFSRHDKDFPKPNVFTVRCKSTGHISPTYDKEEVVNWWKIKKLLGNVA